MRFLVCKKRQRSEAIRTRSIIDQKDRSLYNRNQQTFYYVSGASMFDFNKEDEIFLLAHQGKLMDLQAKIAGNETLLYQKASNGSTLLMFAAEMGHQGVMQWLVEKGADLSEKNKDGLTPFLFAVINGRLETVKWLLKKEATPLDQKQLWLYTTTHARYSTIKWLCFQSAVLSKINHNDDASQLKELRQKIKSLLDELPQQINNIKDFTLVLPYLNSKQITAFVATIQKQSPELIKNIHFKEIRSVWDYLEYEQKKALATAMQQQLPQLISEVKSKTHFNAILDVLTPQQIAELRAARSKKLPSSVVQEQIITPIALQQAGANKEESEKEALSTAKTADEFGRVLQHFNSAQITTLSSQERNRLPKLIYTADELRRVLRYLNPEQITAFCTILTDHLPSIIESINHYCAILARLLPEQITAFIQIRSNHLLDLVKTVDDFDQICDFLNVEQKIWFSGALKFHIQSLTTFNPEFNPSFVELKAAIEQQLQAVPEPKITEVQASQAGDMTFFSGKKTSHEVVEPKPSSEALNTVGKKN